MLEGDVGGTVEHLQHPSANEVEQIVPDRETFGLLARRVAVARGHRRHAHKSSTLDICALASSINAAPGLLFFRGKVRVRIIVEPRENELDGVRLDSFARGEVREVSPSIGSWLIAQEYAVPEMRQGGGRSDDQKYSAVKNHRGTAHDLRRRSSDR